MESSTVAPVAVATALTAPAAPAAAAPPASVVQPRPTGPGKARHFLAFLWWLITGMGLFSHLVGRRDPALVHADEIAVYCVPRSFHLWALVLVGFVGSQLVKHNHPGGWGWIYIWVLLYTFIALLYDVGALRFLLWVLILAFIWLIARYLEDLKHVAILSALLDHFSALQPRLDSGFAAVVSWGLLGPWIGSLFYTYTRGCKRFSPNGIEEWHFEGREVMDRSGLKFRSHYRNVFESVLGLGAGDLEATDNTGHVVKCWENVLFLAFIWPKLDSVLHQRAATVDNAPAEPVEVEDVNKK